MTVSFTKQQVDLMQAALDTWGVQAQVDQTVEEAAELIVALHKHVKRSSQEDTLEKVIDEIADVEMMLAQMRLIFGIDDDTLYKQIERKMGKLEKYLQEDEVEIGGI